MGLQRQRLDHQDRRRRGERHLHPDRRLLQRGQQPGHHLVLAGPRRATSGGTSTAPPAERTSRDLSINGTYTPVVGSFAGVGSPTFDYAQDILWYAPGSTADSLWDFNGNGGTVTKSPLSINGTYTPVAGDFSHDGFNDVIWYAPGTDERLDVGLRQRHGRAQHPPLTINGSYTPIARGELFEQAAHQTDVLWFGAGSKADTIWDFDYGTGHTSPPVSLFGDRTPVLGVFELTETDCCTLQGSDVIDRTL